MASERPDGPGEVPDDGPGEVPDDGPGEVPDGSGEGLRDAPGDEPGDGSGDGPGAPGGAGGPVEGPGDGAELTHLDERGQARMVDVGAKPVTGRTAVAEGRVLLRPDTARRLLDGNLPKGDALPVVRIAGIQAAKRTPELLPLCHHVALTSVEVEVDVDVDTGVVTITATAAAADRTGIEMEALTAVSVAALTLYDLVKAVQKDVRITDVRLRRKTGGSSGDLQLP